MTADFHIDIQKIAWPENMATSDQQDAILAALAALNGKSTEATLAALLAKITASASTESTLSALLSKMTALASTEATLVALLAKVTAAAATEATQAALLTAVQAIGPVKATTVTQLTPVLTLLLSLVIAPANANRKGIVIFNNSANSCYVSLAGTAVAANCAHIIPTFASWECFWPVMYTGAISAIRNAGTGVITAWEFT